MITIAEARKKAEGYIQGTGIHLGKAVDDGEWFIFGYKEEDVSISPVGVHKESGAVEIYFPPHHKAYLKAVEVEG